HEEERLPLKESKRSVTCFETVAKKFSLSVDGVEEIYREYKRKADELMKGYRRLPAPKIRTELEGLIASKSGEKLDWEALEKRRQQLAKPRLSSLAQFFQWLDTMAERLDRLQGGVKNAFFKLPEFIILISHTKAGDRTEVSGFSFFWRSKDDPSARAS